MVERRVNRRGNYAVEYILSGVIVGFLGACIWAGIQWWELNNAESLAARSAFRSALNESAKTGGMGWGAAPPVIPAATGSGSGQALPTLDMMLQGATSVPTGTSQPVPKAPSIDKGFNQINDVLQSR